MNRWRHPTLSLHGIEGAYADPGAKTVIPREVIGKFSLRIVPSQTPDQIETCVRDYIAKELNFEHFIKFSRTLCINHRSDNL